MRYHKKSGLTSSLLAATLLAACIACMGSCTSDGCYDNGSAVPLAKFYNSGTGALATVDSLTARTRERLGTLVQVTDCGVTPGSALSHASGEISERTMPCPVLSLGVPTVIRSDVLAGQEDGDPMFVSRADTDAMVTAYARILASAINGAFSGNPA